MKTDNARFTVRCCYGGMVVLALVINLAPPLFIPLREQLGLTYEQLGRLILINFATQVAFDLLCGPLVDRWGAKRFALGANLFVVAGLTLFAAAPMLFGDAYTGLILGTIIFSMGGGVLELTLSPIVNSVPSERKAADMSLLHSFYAIGQVIVVLLTATALLVLGTHRWQWIVLAWTVLPALTAVGFSRTCIPIFVEEHRRQRLRDLLRKRAFVLAVLAISLAGATEIVISQWVSAYADRGLRLPKIVGDLGGMCLFAVALGSGRLWFGLYGDKVSLWRVMMGGCWFAIGVYLVASLAPWPWVSLGACVLGGLAAFSLWPGMLSVAAERFPRAGASMFAMLSAAGDLGCAVIPWLVGVAADRVEAASLHAGGIYGSMSSEEIGLRAGLLIGILCPIGMLTILYWLRKHPAEAGETPPAQ